MSRDLPEELYDEESDGVRRTLDAGGLSTRDVGRTSGRASDVVTRQPRAGQSTSMRAASSG